MTGPESASPPPPAASRRRALLLAAALAVLLVAALTLPVKEWALRGVELAGRLGAGGAVAYAAAYALACVLLVPGLPLSLGAGFLYGSLGGLAVALAGAVAGATAAFLVARHLAGRWLVARLPGSPHLARVHRVVSRGGFRAVLLLRLTPLVPFNALNYALGLTDVRLRDYVAGSALGMLPATALVVHAGAAVRDLSGLSGGPAGPERLALLALGTAGTLAVAVAAAVAARRELRAGGDPP